MKNNKMLYISIMLLSVISLLGMSNFDNSYLTKQIMWLLIGLITFLIIKKINISFLLRYSFWIYLFNVFLLILVLLIGRRINGAKAWFSFGIFSLQPSELMKISLSLIYYKMIKEKKENLLLIKIIILFLIPSILVFLEPDTGAIIMYLILMLVALFNSKIKKEYIFFILLIGFFSIISFLILYFYNSNLLIKILGTSIFYRIDRIIQFKNNYQLNQALIYIGSAGIKGHKNILYIPEAHTDFIFAFLIGRYGIVLGIIILLCYLIIDLILINQSKHNYLLKVFIALLLTSETINILMNIGLFPIMGIPLPFLSYGGTNTIINLLFLGTCLNKKSKIV